MKVLVLACLVALALAKEVNTEKNVEINKTSTVCLCVENHITNIANV